MSYVIDVNGVPTKQYDTMRQAEAYLLSHGYEWVRSKQELGGYVNTFKCETPEGLETATISECH